VDNRANDIFGSWGGVVEFLDVLAKVAWTLLSEGRVSYCRIKRTYNVDDGALEDLRHELIVVKHVAVDLEGEFLVWTGTAGSESATAPGARVATVRQLAAEENDNSGQPPPTASPHSGRRKVKTLMAAKYWAVSTAGSPRVSTRMI
jgi:hypothetical protein